MFLCHLPCVLPHPYFKYVYELFPFCSMTINFLGVSLKAFKSTCISQLVVFHAAIPVLKSSVVSLYK